MSRFFSSLDVDRSVLLALPIAIVIGLAMVLAVEGLFFTLDRLFVWLRWIGLPLWLLPIIGGGIVSILLLLFRAKRFEGLIDLQDYTRHSRAYHSVQQSMGAGAGVLSLLAHTVALTCGSFSGILGPLAYFAASILRLVLRCMPSHDFLPMFVERHVMAAAVAAALSAALNAPLAAVFFAYEVILRQPNLRRLLPIMMAALTASIAQRWLFDDVYPLSEISFHVNSIVEYGYFAFIGLFVGVLAILFSHSVRGVQRLATPLTHWRPLLAGVLLALIMSNFASDLPQYLGVSTMVAVLKGNLLNMDLPILLLLLVAIIISIGCGYGSGIFAPSLVIGALVGGQIGLMLSGFSDWHAAIGIEVSHVGIYALVGMAAFCAAVLGAPFFAIMLAFELSLSYAMTSAVMLACILSVEVMSTFCAKSYIHLLRGVRGE